MSQFNNNQDSIVQTSSDLTNVLKDIDIKQRITEILEFDFAKRPEFATKNDLLDALSILVRGFVFSKIAAIKGLEKQKKPKFVNYLSMEFLIGRSLNNYINFLGLHDKVEAALASFGSSIDELSNIEVDPGLGNGGLGRLAACFLSSMAKLGIPSFGYGIRYEYGMFKQKIIDGYQVEVPDNWLLEDYNWEHHRPEIKYGIKFSNDELSFGQELNLNKRSYSTIYATAYDVLITAGQDSSSISRLRLWRAVSGEDIVLKHFNVGDYARAFHQKNAAEHISSVLYPDDTSEQGKILRFKQGYFFSSASVQDIIYRFKQNHDNLLEMPNFQVIHLNDTHPAFAIPEFMRILTIDYAINWADAWRCCTKVFSYTNHTLLPEALELWGIKFFNRFLPHILDVIYQINEEFLNALRGKHRYDNFFLSRVSLIDESNGKSVRMAHLSVVAASQINGVSKLHSDIMQKGVFKDFVTIWPNKFTNVTNGVDQRRWLFIANPYLTASITKHIGTDWLSDFTQIKKLKEIDINDEVKNDFASAKRSNKIKLAQFIEQEFGEPVNLNSIFDVQIKRIHEYKRQLLKLFHVIHLYDKILKNPSHSWVPRTVIISGKAASAYYNAKLIIRCINDVATFINKDERTNHLLKLFFIPNYSVKLAELIIPAADLSEQISTAGFEASGTSNMKLTMNGALTIGTYDGANVEIMEKVGIENFFLFGNNVEDINQIKSSGYDALYWYNNDASVKLVIDSIRQGRFSSAANLYVDLVNSLLGFDHYMLLADFDSYLKAQEKVEQVYLDQADWMYRVVINVASMADFSSDASISNYASKIWKVKGNFN